MEAFLIFDTITLYIIYLLFFKSNNKGAIFNKMEMTVKIISEFAIVGTTSAKDDHSSALTQLETMVYSASNVSVVKDKPITMASL